jgi:hypothetical protein
MRIRLTKAEEENEARVRMKNEGQNITMPLYQSVANLNGEKYVPDRF